VALTGTYWLSMVRRRSTVRFRKGAPRSEAFFDTDPVTFARQIPAEGTGQRLGWQPEPWRSRRLKMVRAGHLGQRGECHGGHFGGQDRYQAALRGVRGPVRAVQQGPEGACVPARRSQRLPGCRRDPCPVGGCVRSVGGRTAARRLSLCRQLLARSRGCHAWPAIDAASGGQVADT
jgi:hypothetical protein